MNGLLNDLRYSIRALRKTPAFTAIAVVTFALGVGANTAVFSLFDQVLLRMLPVEAPQRLVFLDDPGAFPGRTQGNQTFSYPMYRDLRRADAAFEGVAARFGTDATVVADGRAERVRAELVSGNYFSVVGLRPSLGRAFTADDDKVPGGHPVVMLSHAYWVARFASDPAVLHQKILVNGLSMDVIGVGPAGFNSVQREYNPDILVPLLMKAQMTPTWNDLENRRSRWLTVVARLQSDKSLAQAEASANVLYRQLVAKELEELPNASARLKEAFRQKHLVLSPGAQGRLREREDATAMFRVLLGLVGLVLLVACSNIAGLLLARGITREHEIAVRLSIGATRPLLVRQQLIECGLLAAVGAVFGLLVANWTMTALVSLLPPVAGTHVVAEPDWRAVGFAFALASAAALVSGILPALRGSQLAPGLGLNERAATGAAHTLKLRTALVVAQITIAMVLLVTSGLFIRTLHNLKIIDPGFRTEGLLTFVTDPSLSGYSGEQTHALLGDLSRDVGALSGVRSATCARFAPLTNSSWTSSVDVEGYHPGPEEDDSASVNAIGPAYFSTLGIPVIAGREFTDRDALGAPLVAVVSESFVKRYFAGRSPIGRHVSTGRGDPQIEIVGVVRDARSLNKREEPEPSFYTPFMQHRDVNEMTFLVRTAGPPEALADAMRAAVRRRDINLPVFRVSTMNAQVDETLSSERMLAALSAAFGAIAVALAVVGLYGLIAYAVARRTREIGIRMALGADESSVVTLVVRDAAFLLIVGIAAGVPIAMGSSRLLRSQLFGLSPQDPVTLLAAGAVLAIAVLSAAYLPARRAAHVDPVQALRSE